MENKNGTTIVLIFGISLVIGCIIIGNAISNIKQPPKMITVMGSAQRIIESDATKWTIKLSRQVELTP
jgi:hypothetical protein